MPLNQFDPPGFVSELSAELTEKWSSKIKAYIRYEQESLKPTAYKGYFFNELEKPEAEPGDVLPIVWDGFPNFWNNAIPSDEIKKWDFSEYLYTIKSNQIIPYQGTGNPFRQQDEYLEWKTFRNPSGKIEKIVFTCESPEYWEFIAEHDEQLLLKLYKKYVNQNVQINDLFTSDPTRTYNRTNKWNTANGILHLTQRANTLSAEINLAAQATILRKNASADPITDTQELIKCSGYGEPTRFSDPTIGAAINSLVRDKFAVTLRNPIGLYISKIKTGNIDIPNGIRVKDCWHVIRGDAANGMILRAEFKLPEGQNFDMEDIKVGGKKLHFGAQLAELIEMVIYGKRFRFQQSSPPTVGCGQNFALTVSTDKKEKNVRSLNPSFNTDEY